MSRKRISFDPEDPRIRDIINDIAAEYDVPPGDLLNAAVLRYLLEFAKGEVDIPRRKISRLLRYSNRLDLSELLDDFKARFDPD